MPKTTGKNAEGGIVITQIPYLPLEIQPDEIAEISMIDGNERAFLLDKNIRAQILEELKDKPDGRYVKSKKGDPAFQLKTPSKYSVIKYEGEYYILAGRAGAGSYGVVKYAQNMKGEWLVLKTFSEKHQRKKGGKVEQHKLEDIQSDAAEEYQQLIEAKRAKGSRPIERKSPSKGEQQAILMENARGMNLQKYLDNLKAAHKTLTAAQWLELIKNLCATVDELHKKQKKLHRDLKLENFMIDPRTGKVSLIDLGFSTGLSDKPDGKIVDDNDPGNKLSMAPEIKARHEYSTKSDVYGLGVTIATMFEIDDYDQVKDRTFLLGAAEEEVANNRYINAKDAFKEIRFLAQYMMLENPDKRPKLTDVMYYITQYQKKISEQVNVGLVFVDDYRNCKAEEKAAFVEKLKKFDEVILIDTNPDGSVKDQIKLVRELDKANISASNRVFKGNDIETVVAEVEKTIKADSPERKYNLEVVGEDVKVRVFKQKWSAFQSAIGDIDAALTNPKTRLAERRINLAQAWQSLEQMKNELLGVAAEKKTEDRKDGKKNLAEEIGKEKLRRDVDAIVQDQKGTALDAKAPDKADIQPAAAEPVMKAEDVETKRKELNKRLDAVAQRIDDLIARNKDDTRVSVLASSLRMILADKNDIREFINERLSTFHELIRTNTLSKQTHARVIAELNSIDAEVLRIRGEMTLLPQQTDTDILQEIDEAVKRQMAKKRKKPEEKKAEPVAPQNQAVQPVKKVVASKSAAMEEEKYAELQQLDSKFTKQVNELLRITGNLKSGYWRALNRNLNDILTCLQRTDISAAQKNDYLHAHMNLVKKVVHELAPAQPESMVAAKQATTGESDSDADLLAEWNKIKKALSDIDAVIKDPAKALAAKQKYIRDSWSFLEIYKDHIVTGQRQFEEKLTPDNADARRGAEAVFRIHKELELEGRGDEEKNAGIRIHQIHGAIKLPGLIADIGSTLDEMAGRESNIEAVLMFRINKLRRKGDKSDADLLELASSYNSLGKIFIDRNDYKNAEVIIQEGLTEISKIIPNNDAKTLASLFTPLAAKRGEGHPERNGLMADIVFQKALAYEQLAIANIKNNEMNEVRINYNNAAAIFVNFPKDGAALFNSTDNERVINRFGAAAKRVIVQAKSIGSVRMHIERQSSDPNIVALKESLAMLEVNANKYRMLNIDTPELNRLIGKVELMIRILSIPQLPAEFREKAFYRFKLDNSVMNTIKEVNGIKDESMMQGIWFDAVKGIIRSATNGLSSQLAAQAKQEILSGAESGKRFVELQTNLLKSIDELDRAVEAKPTVEKKASISEKLLATQKIMKTYVIQYEQRLLEVPALKELIAATERLAKVLADSGLSTYDKEKALYDSKFESLIKAAAQELNGITVEPFKKGVWFDAVKINLRVAYSEAKNELARKAKSEVGLPPPKVEKKAPLPPVQEKAKEPIVDKGRAASVQDEIASLVKVAASSVAHKPAVHEIAAEDKKEYLRQLAKHTLANVSDEAIFKLRQELGSDANEQFFHDHPKTQNTLREALLQSIIISASMKTDIRDQLNMFEKALSDPVNQVVLSGNPQTKNIFMSAYQDSIDRATQELCDVSRRLFAQSDDLDKTEQWRSELRKKYKDLDKTEQWRRDLEIKSKEFTDAFSTVEDAELKTRLGRLSTLNKDVSAKLKTFSLPSEEYKKAAYDADLGKLIAERNAIAEEISKNNPQAAAIAHDMNNLEANIIVSNNSFYKYMVKSSVPAAAPETVNEKWGRLAAMNNDISTRLKSASIPSDDEKRAVYDDGLIKLIAERNALAEEICGDDPRIKTTILDMRKLEADITVSNNSFYESAIKASNLLSRYVEAEILSAQDQATRIIVMERWVSIMQRCFEIGDFQATNAILFALNSSEVNKLRLTKNGLSESAKLIIKIIQERSFRTLDVNAGVNTMQARDDHLIPYSPTLTMAIDKLGETQGKQNRLEIFSNIERARQRQKASGRSAPREDSLFQKAVFAQTQIDINKHNKAMGAKTAQLAEYQQLKPLKDDEKQELVNKAKPSVVQSKALANIVIPEILPWMQREHVLYEKWNTITTRLRHIPDEMDEYKTNKLDKVKDAELIEKIGKCYAALLSNELPPNIDWKDRLLALDIVVNNKNDDLNKLKADNSKKKVVDFINAINVDDDKVRSVLKKMLSAYQERERFDAEVKATPKPEKTIDTISIEPKAESRRLQPAQVQAPEKVEHPLLPSEQLDRIFADLMAYQEKLNTKAKADEFRKTVTKNILDKLINLKGSIAERDHERVSRDVQTLVRSVGIFRKDEKLNRHLHWDLFKKMRGKRTTLSNYLSDLESVLKPAAARMQVSAAVTITIEEALPDGNCAFNAFTLGSQQKQVLDKLEAARAARGLPSLDQDNEFREKFVMPAAKAFGLKQNARWPEVKAEILKRRNGSKDQVQQLQKLLAPIMRSLAVELGRKDAVHKESTVQPFLSAFADYVNAQLQITRAGQQVEDDIFRRHSFIMDKFAASMPEFSKEFTPDDVREYNKLRNFAKTAEENNKLDKLEEKYDRALDKLKGKLQAWWTSSQDQSKSGYDKFMEEMKKPSVFAGDLELGPLARFFGVNLDVNRPALAKPFRMNSANGAIPAAGMDQDVINQLADRQIIDRPNADSKELRLNEATPQEIGKHLDEVPDHSDVLNTIEKSGGELKHKDVPSYLSKECIDELRVRNVIEYKDFEKPEKGFRFIVDPEVALARIGKMVNRDELMDLWRKYYNDVPTVVLSNVSAVHWDNVAATPRVEEVLQVRSQGPRA